MPELPEVETVKNSLHKLVIGEKITEIEIRYSKIIKNISPEQFREKLIGQTIKDIKRLGKYLIFILDDYYLISHLRMEGKYLLRTNEEKGKHEHIIFYFQDRNLRYHDTRKFGTMYLYGLTEDIYHLAPLDKVGLEPFNKYLTIDYLKTKLTKSNRAIKTILLDQTIISGLGNIYVDEVLFKAHINPLTPACKLTDEQLQEIIEDSQSILTKAIELGGTTIRTFTSHDVSGRFQNELQIHGKKECPNCHEKVEKIFVGGRGTYHCKNCQKLDK